jgi:hypothetical protein
MFATGIEQRVDCCNVIVARRPVERRLDTIRILRMRRHPRVHVGAGRSECGNCRRDMWKVSGPVDGDVHQGSRRAIDAGDAHPREFGVTSQQAPQLLDVAAVDRLRHGDGDGITRRQRLRLRHDQK